MFIKHIKRVTVDNAKIEGRVAIRTEMTQGDARTMVQSKVFIDQRFNKLEASYQAAVTSSVTIAS